MTKRPLVLAMFDLHLHQDNVDEILSIATQARDICLEQEINYIFIGGDLFTTRTGQPLASLLAVKTIINTWIDAGIIVYAIPGNHDKSSLESESSYLDVYHRADEFIVLRKEESILLDGVLFHFLPYFKEGGSYKSRLKILSEKCVVGMPNVLTTHIAVKGVRNNDGSQVENDIGMNLFKNFDLVIVGHYHNRSYIGHNILYAGSTHPQNYGEDNEKGFTVIYDDGTEDHIIAQFREYHTLKIPIEEVTPALLEKLAEDKADGKKIRLKITGDKAKLDTLNTKALKNLGIDFRKEADEVIAEIEAAKSDEVVTFTEITIIEEFEPFCNKNEFSEESRAIGLKYLTEGLCGA